nr:RES family NAD+ phosphorylase [Spirosoma radiotolerans]
MDVYRLANVRRADDLTGTGARLTDGCWNDVGTSVLYIAGSRSLAALEVLVIARSRLYRTTTNCS